MKKYVIGIDNGSQSTKVAIYDTDGNEICYGTHYLRPTETPEPGVVFHPDDDLWDSVVGGIESCLNNFDGNRKDILGIGLCTIRCCRVMLKEDGTLQQPVLSWMDLRLSKPYEHVSDEVKYVTTTSGYLAYKLTGEMKDTTANLEVYWPLDWKTLEWSNDEKVMQENGVTREMLFDLVKPGEAFGPIKDELAERFGFTKGIPVVATANDKAVEVLGAGVIKPTQITISLGTFISAMLFREEYFENAQNFFPTLACVPFSHVYECWGIRRGMWTISWFKKLIGEELEIRAKELGISEEDYLNKVAAEQVPPGSDGLITILDWLAPWNAPYRKGVMLGFDQRHTKFHMYRSILEAISYTIKNNIDLMLNEIGGKLDEIVVIGGGAKSDLMMQIIADMFGIKAVRRQDSSSACLGSAICVLKNLNYYPDFESAVNDLVKTKDTFLPNPENTKLYSEINEKVIKGIKNHTDEVLRPLYSIHN